MFSDPSPSGASTSSSWVFAEEDHANITEAARLQSSSISALVERMWGALATNDKDDLDELFGQLADTDTGIITQLGFGGASLDADSSSGELLSPGVALKLLPKLWTSSLPVTLVYINSSKCGAATAVRRL